MKIPYGISNFKKLRTEGFIYTDKTRAIEILEKSGAEYVFFIRPRRFGKSLFLSMLQHYYDIDESHNFDKFFKDLYIGKNPTPLKNSYLVMQLDFSGLNTDTKEALQKSFIDSVRTELIGFLKKYEKQLKTAYETLDQLRKTEDIRSMLGLVF
ncbi:AAA family ATPase, partial [Peptococcaceae bacterium]|nr:AAA family ATPase [Peptococcaceae bacterium]